MNESKIIVALDYADAQSAKALVDKLDPSLCKLKVGKELFTSAGPSFVEYLVNKQYQVFLDLKFHDIPNTVAKACSAAAKLGVWMLNVHASGGQPMMEAAQEALDKSYGQNRPYLIAVTVLTSMDEMTLRTLGVQRSMEEQVLSLASLAKNAGLDGVVCSAQEASMIRNALGENFRLVTPGIRPLDSNKDDQTRIVTPMRALQLGAHYLVIGRPITQAINPIEKLTTIINEI